MAGNRDQMPPLPPQAGESHESQMPLPPSHEGSAPVEELPKKSVAKPIEVIAVAKGFFKCNRYEEGQHFMIAKFEQLGTWMRCVDPLLQKKHEENQKRMKDNVKKKLKKEEEAGE